MSFDIGQNVGSTLFKGGNALNTTINAGRNLKSALSNLSSAGDISSMLRSSSLPLAGESVGDIMSSIAMFTSNENPNDWRVRLSLPSWPSFTMSPVLDPLNKAGGLIFPYTPQITLSNGAKYEAISPIHSNHPFHAYVNSQVEAILISAAMNVENTEQGLYWIAAFHYLRALTKMFSGSDFKAGNPPPIVKFNAYGNYVFKNVPVAVIKFDTTLGNDCDYISVPVKGSLMGEISGIDDSLGGVSDMLGSEFDSISDITSDISSGLNAISTVSDMLGTFGVGGGVSAGITRVPTKSVFSITLQPMYSRESVRKFSLDKFVTGAYANSNVGYI